MRNHAARRLASMVVGSALLVGAAACTSNDSTSAAGDGASSDAALDAAQTTTIDASSPGDAMASATDAGAVPTFDLSADMSFTANPHGAWSFGHTSGATLADSAFVLDTFTAAAPPGMFWHPDATQDGYYPYIAQNTSDAATYGSSMGWAARAGEVAMEAKSDGSFAVARLIAPAPGSYTLTVHVEGVHFSLSTTDFHVTQNDHEIYRVDIDGYGGDPSFHAVQGSNPSADFTSTLSLATGDVLLFALGYGANMTNFNDTTGISVHLAPR